MAVRRQYSGCVATWLECALNLKQQLLLLRECFIMGLGHTVLLLLLLLLLAPNAALKGFTRFDIRNPTVKLRGSDELAKAFRRRARVHPNLIHIPTHISCSLDVRAQFFLRLVLDLRSAW